MYFQEKCEPSKISAISAFFHNMSFKMSAVPDTTTDKISLLLLLLFEASFKSLKNEGIKQTVSGARMMIIATLSAFNCLLYFFTLDFTE